jgi:hypothetical protein
MSRRLVLAAAVAILAAPTATAAARPVPARSYLGVTPGGGVVTLDVGPGAHRLLGFRLRNAPGDCMGTPSREGEDGIPLPIRGRRFRGGFDGDVSLHVRGRLLGGGEARGTYSYFDRGDCSADGPWRARVERASTGRGPRVFTLAGGRGPVSARSGPATAINTDATGLAPLAGGGLAVSDAGYARYGWVRLVSPLGRLTTLAGGPGTLGTLDYPQGIAAEPDGTLLVAVSGDACVRRVTPAGASTTAAGVCSDGGDTAGFSGDGGPATAAHLDYPAGVAALPGGGFVIADLGNDRIREVSAAGIITTIAGNGTEGFAGDGGPATAAALNRPNDVAVEHDGRVLIADEDNGRVRAISPGGIITTVAGGGTPTLARGIGDGGPATQATLLNPSGVEARPHGAFLVTDSDLGRIRRVAHTGVISTELGGGPLPGPGVPARDADLASAWKVTTTADHELAWIADGRVQIAPHRDTHRLLTAIRPEALAVRRGRSARFALVSTRAAGLTVDVVRHRHRVRRRRSRAHAGVTRLALRGLPRGGYHVVVTARVARRVAVAGVALTVR